METISLNEIPSYIKNSEVYSNLIEQNVEYIYIEHIPLFKLIEVDKMRFEDFEELLHTIYFWKIPFEQYPIELFIYIDDDFGNVKDYLKTYNNKLTELLLQWMSNKYFLAFVISKYSNYHLLNCAIEHNPNNVNVFGQNNLSGLNKNFCGLCKFGNMPMIKYMFNKFSNNIDINYNNGLALSWSAENGHLDVVEFLFKNGANMYARDDYALCQAARNGHLEIAQLLLENGANIHLDNDLALCYAFENEHLNVCELLVKNGANIHVNNDRILWYFVDTGHLNFIKFFLKNGISLFINNNCILCKSAENGHLDVIEFLLQYSLEIKQKFRKNILLSIVKKTQNNRIKGIIQKYIDENL